MGFRIRRTASILPGVRLNVSKSGPSLTFGRRGLHYTIGRRGTRTTIGLPGSGISYTSYSPFRRRARAGGQVAGQAAGGCLLPVLTMGIGITALVVLTLVLSIQSL